MRTLCLYGASHFSYFGCGSAALDLWLFELVSDFAFRAPSFILLPWRPLRLCARLFLVQRQRERERAAFAKLALDPDLTPVQFDKLPSQCQS